jgi:hypothetical protein
LKPASMEAEFPADEFLEHEEDRLSVGLQQLSAGPIGSGSVEARHSLPPSCKAATPAHRSGQLHFDSSNVTLHQRCNRSLHQQARPRNVPFRFDDELQRRQRRRRGSEEGAAGLALGRRGVEGGEGRRGRGRSKHGRSSLLLLLLLLLLERRRRPCSQRVRVLAGRAGGWSPADLASGGAAAEERRRRVRAPSTRLLRVRQELRSRLPLLPSRSRQSHLRRCSRRTMPSRRCDWPLLPRRRRRKQQRSRWRRGFE